MTDILWTDELEARVAAVEATFAPRPAEHTHFHPAPDHACKIWCSGGNIYLEYEYGKDGKKASIHIPRNRSGIEALLLTLIERDKRQPRPQASAHALFMAINQYRGPVHRAKSPKYRGARPPKITLAQLGLVKPEELNLESLGLKK